MRNIWQGIKSFIRLMGSKTSPALLAAVLIVLTLVVGFVVYTYIQADRSVDTVEKNVEQLDKLPKIKDGQQTEPTKEQKEFQEKVDKIKPPELKPQGDREIPGTG